MKLARRKFLKWGAMLTATMPGIPGFLNRTAFAAPAVGPTIGRSQEPILVMVQLTGGNDGLNSLIPYSDPAYRGLRPRLGVPQSELLPLDDNFALHPAMGSLHGLWKEGVVAAVYGVGYPNPSRSHFRSTEIWHTANPDSISETRGWLGRYLDHVKPGSPLYAVNLGDATEGSMRRASEPVPIIPNLEALDYRTIQDPVDRDAQLAALSRVYDASGGRPQDQFLRGVANSAFEAARDLHSSGRSYSSSIQYPPGPLAQQLRLIAQLIIGGSGTRVFSAWEGGFDTHAAQVGSHERILADLSDGIVAFVRDLREHGESQNVIVSTYSEFGRRAKENGSGGTDHGTAAPLFVIGDPVKGGYHGPPLNLFDLDDQGDLKYTVDFRSVYATLMDRWLGAPSVTILGGNFPPLDLIR